MPVTERTYEAVVLEDPEGQWELHRGRLREKPGMGTEHNDVMIYLAHLLIAQLPRRAFKVKANSARVRTTTGAVYIPVDDKLPEYMRRGDQEIWRLHPFEQTLTAWRRQSDGGYRETTYRSGVVRSASLQGVEIDLAALFSTE